MTQPRSPRRARRVPSLGAAAGLLVFACSSEEPPEAPSDFISTGEIRSQLTRAQSCDELLSGIQDGVLDQLARRVEEIRERGEQGAYYGYDEDVLIGGVGDPVPATAPNPSGGPASMSADGATAGSADGEGGFSAPPPRADAPSNSEEAVSDEADRGATGGGFSGTTVQVQDIDEADIVKTDGDRMYVLHGGTVFALHAWPAAEVSVIGSALIEGEPVEMFVHDGKAVVFSRVYRDLRAATDGVDESRGYYSSVGYTKITVLDVSGEDQPPTVQESYVEGNYVSSRRHEGIVRAVVQEGFKVPYLGNPNVEFRDPFGNPYSQGEVDAQLTAWFERMVGAVRGTDLGNWLPREFAKEDGQLVEVAPRCTDYYSPDAGLTETGVTSIVSLDLDDLDAGLGGATILGRAERVYANADVVLVSQTDYRYRIVEDAPREQTVLHLFDVDGPQTAYTASGTVIGRIHNQFSLDERDGIIRVSTTEERFEEFGVGGVTMGGVVGTTPTVGATEPPPVAEGEGDAAPDPLLEEAPEPMPAEPDGDLPPPPVDRGFGPVNRIVTLRADGQELVEVGSTSDFGFNERIYATRFLGDRGYVVTFRRTDPLFVVDLSDPASPAVVGELHIPGFSDYLYPLGSDYLFAVGQDADENGRVRGLALQLFDVSDPTAPTLFNRYVYEESGFSPANIDHRAITFHNDRDLVAFPFQNYQTGQQTLELFQVSTETGIERLGGMSGAPELSIEECVDRLGYDPGYVEELLAELEENPEWQNEIIWECQWGYRFRRGVFRDDIVYGIGTRGIYAYSLEGLEGAPIGSVDLPREVYDYGGDTTSPGRPVQGPVMVDAPPPDEPDAVEPAGTGGAASSQDSGGSSDSADEEEAAQ